MEILSHRKRQQPARDRARRWLLCILSDGPLTVELIRAQAHASGIAWRTVQRASKGMVTSMRSGFTGGYWLWKIATPETEERHKQGICPHCGKPIGEAHS